MQLISSEMGSERQTCMFSATFPPAVQDLAKGFLKQDHLFLSVGRVGSTTNIITQKILKVEQDDKLDELFKILCDPETPKGRTLIFVETKRTADYVDNFLYEKGLPVTSIHGDRSQREREDALFAFK